MSETEEKPDVATEPGTETPPEAPPERLPAASDPEEPRVSQPPTVSLSRIWHSVSHLPFPEKLFWWGGTVFFCSTFLPWTEGQNGWTSDLQVLLNLVLIAGVVLQSGALAGVGPGLSDGVLKILRYAVPAAGLILLFRLTVGPRLGMLIGCLAIAIQLTGLYRILEARGLLPIRITK